MKLSDTLKIDEQFNIGHAKYVVNYYTGKKHADGSDFYAIAIFQSKKAKESFIAALRAAVYAGWTQASVGCHWTRGPYAISTVQGGNEPSGYSLTRNREPIGGRYPNFIFAAAAADADQAAS